MNEKLVDYLNRTKPNQETIEAATRSFLSELTEDLPPPEMKRKMIGSDPVQFRGGDCNAHDIDVRADKEMIDPAEGMSR